MTGIGRRDFIKGAIGGAGASLVASCAEPLDPEVRVPKGAESVGRAPATTTVAVARAPAVIPPESARPIISYGVQSGEVTEETAMIWSRSDRLARMVVEWATDPSFKDARRVPGPVATAATDFTAKVELRGLPPGARLHYRVRFEVPDDPSVASEPSIGSLKTAPIDKRDILFAWSGDVAGQGYGINLEWGGMRIFETLRSKSPDFFIHSGDQIYADNPIPAEKKLPDGYVWRNVTTPAKSKVAETLDDFRGNFAYNLLDVNVRRFNAEVPLIVQWDDHEVHNNWFPAMTLEKDRRYKEKSASVLAERALRAMIEYTPVKPPPSGGPAVYRALRYGPLLDVIVLDERSYRGPNTKNRQKSTKPTTKMLGEAQLAWLKKTLAESKATWKIIASDMPLGLIVRDYEGKGEPNHDGWANTGGPPRGRELEIAELLSFIKAQGVQNIVWLTADVHYAAAHHYHPSRAQFVDFLPFWEFVAGPMNAGSFGPNKLDTTFGPRAVFVSAHKGRAQDLPPSAGHQSFGTVSIDASTEAMTVTLHDLEGKKLYQVELPKSQ